MVAMNDLARQIADKNPGPRSSEHAATVVGKDAQGTYWVSIPGGSEKTPVATALVEASAGDTVMVAISGGRCIMSGNVSSPGASTRSVSKVGAVANMAMTTAYSEKARIDELSATALTARSALITDLQADTAKVHDLTAEQIGAATAYVGTLSAGDVTAQDIISDHAAIGSIDADSIAADHAVIANLDSNYAHLTNGVIDNATIGHADVDGLSANYAHVTNGTIDNATIGHADVDGLSANYAHVTNGTIDNAKIGYADVNGLNANYAQIDMANVSNAWIENGTIKDGAISSAMINDVSANKLTAGTINGSVINVTNLNADNITAGTINGQRIGTGSLSLDKLSEDVYTEAEVNAIVDGLNDRIDGAIETHTGTVVPTLNNSPASAWNTTDLKDEHVGDVYYVVNSQSQQNGYCYRFTKSGNTYSWQLIKDSDVTAALSRLTTAEGKITTFDSDISTLKTDTGTLQTRTTSLETRADGVDETLLDKVDVTDFNELEDTVDGHTQTLSQHTTAISNKADGSTVTALTTRVSKNEQDISGINTTIGQLQTTVESKADGSTVSALQSDYTTFKQNVTQFESTVGSTYATKTELGNIKVGGRNHVLNSCGVLANNRGSAAGSRKEYIALNLGQSYMDVPEGTQVVVSFDIVMDVATANPTLQVYNSNNDGPKCFSGMAGHGEAGGVSHFFTAAAGSTISERVSVIGYIRDRDNPPLSTNWLEFYSNYGSSNFFSIANLKLEVGNKATDWTPAPEDMATNAQVSAIESRVSTNETSIQQTNQAVALKANSSDVYTKSATDGLISTEVTNRNAAITAASNAINLSVSQNYTTKTEFNNLEIGGRNLLFGSGDFSTDFVQHGSTDGTYVDGGYGSASKSLSITTAWRGPHVKLGQALARDNAQIGDKYVLSAWFKNDEEETLNPTGGSINLSFGVNRVITSSSSKARFDNGDEATYPYVRDMAPGVWHRLWIAFEVTEYSLTASTTRFETNHPKKVLLSAYKLERGTKPTDWTPAPEDIDTRVTAAEAAIVVNANGISSKVSKTDYTGETVATLINQSADSVKIQANHVVIDGTATFNAIKSSADAVYDAKGSADTRANEISSRGEQLITNGSGTLGNNTNFSAWTYDPSVAMNGSAGSFTIPKEKVYRLPVTDEFLPVSTSEQYLLSFDMMSETEDTKLPVVYACVNTFDIDKNPIVFNNVHYPEGTLTTLAQDLKSGDTEVYLANVDSSFAYATNRRGLTFWNYTNSKGYTYPPGTYSRNVYTRLFSSQSQIDTSNNKITLDSAWTGPTYAAGTSVSMCQDGPTYIYVAASNVRVPSTPTHYEGTIGPGTAPGGMGESAPMKFRDGTAYAKIGFLWNYAAESNAQIWLANLNFRIYNATHSEVASAQSAADSAAAEEQYIYISKGAGTTSVAKNETWVSDVSGNQNTWTAKRPQYSSEHPVLFVARQSQTVAQKAAGTTCSCTTPHIDDTTTIIDGGNIITNSITSEKLAAKSVTADQIDATNLQVDSANIKGQLSVEQIDTSGISLTKTQVENLDGDLASLSDGIEAQASALEDSVGGINQAIEATNASLSNLTDTVTNVAAELDGRIKTITDSIDIDADHISLITQTASGGTTEKMEARLTSSKLAFMQDGTEVAYIGDESLNITNAVVQDTLTLGDFAFVPLASGGLALKWMGE